jgi:polar amino acid transport system permease protein
MLFTEDLSTRVKNLLAAAVALMLIGTAFGVQMITNPPEAAPFDLLPTMLRGLNITIQLTVFGALLALVVAIFTGVLRASPFLPVRAITGLYVEVFRGTSVLVQMFWMVFVLPQLGLNLSPLQAGILALGLNVGAYGAEVVRGAIKAIPRGQIEAATALNMSPGLMMRRVILPQAMVRILPPFGNLLIELLKATSLASLILLADVTFQAQTLRQSVGVARITEIYGLLLVIYFVISYPLTLGVRWLESKRRWA